MTWIPEGVYLSGPLDQPVWLSGYHIDSYPVTNADYLMFVTAAGYPPPHHWNRNRPPAAAGFEQDLAYRQAFGAGELHASLLLAHLLGIGASYVGVDPHQATVKHRS